MLLLKQLTGNFWSDLRRLYKTMRSQPWAESAVIYTALVFDGKLLQPDLFLSTTLIVLSFWLAGGSVYLLNHCIDVIREGQPSQRQSQLSHQPSLFLLMLVAVVLAIMSLWVSTWLDVQVGVVTAVYLLLHIIYSLYLKTIVLVDVMVVSLGLLLRVFAGVVFVDVQQFSPWLYVCISLLALFLGFGKRRHDILRLEEVPNHHSSLGQYNVYLLDQILLIVTTSMLIAYTLYTFGASTALAGGGRLLLTVPFVFYFVARYLYLVQVKKLGGAPEELLLKDKPLLVNSLLWVVAVVGFIYVE